MTTNKVMSNALETCFILGGLLPNVLLLSCLKLVYSRQQTVFAR